MATYDYDLIVIGGGSGGLAAAKKAASYGAKVALFDYVKPSTQGTTWGLGGTCVNVGCVPKKLMHYAGLLGQGIKDSKKFGWNVNGVSHDWATLVQTVGDHVHQLNFSYRAGLVSNYVQYINALATFEDDHTVSYTPKSKNPTLKKVTAAKFVIAVGGRPHVPSDIPGALEYAITSDDIFSLTRSPGKTLSVGGAYISLETSGFLTELGYDVTVAVRSVLLRGFDRQMAEKIGRTMEELGTKFVYGSPKSITKREDGRLDVVLAENNGTVRTEVFDTVYFATGRTPDVSGLNLKAAGVNIDPVTKKIIVSNAEQTSAPHIYALGDIIGQSNTELTPVAIRTGNLLASRLFGGSSKLMEYSLVPTTVFTPVEYGAVGLTEEEAIKIYGEDDIEVYLSEFNTLEVAAAHREKHDAKPDDIDPSLHPICLSKLITVKSLKERVVGFHFIGPNAGEVTQGFALSVKLGATKSDFDDLVGIHPTDAESFADLSITKRSGETFTAAGGCGGGKCG